jgi:choline dehydrogenase-like flavoprotein
VTIDASTRDQFGLPTLRVRHAYTARDNAAASALIGQAKRILRAAGARFTWVHPIDTFSHALGTVRMGPDESTSPLDADGRYRGLDNLHVVDGSALPRSAGVNPSLTIAANALRVGALLGGMTGAELASAGAQA